MKHKLLTIAVVLLTLSALCAPVQGQRVYVSASHVRTLDFSSSGYPGASCRGMAITSDDATVWASAHPNWVMAIDVASLTSTAYDVPCWAVSGIALTPDDSQVCVPGRENNRLTMLNTATGGHDWVLNMSWPQTVVIDKQGKYAYTANVPYPDHHIRVVDLDHNSTVAVVHTG